MNKWVKKSIKLASSDKYLDNLMKIYPVDLNLPRKIKPEEKERIRKIFKTRNKKNLISVLLELKRFPIDDPYVAFLRKDRKALDKNPKTIQRIGKKLYSMNLKEIFIGASRPKSPSRQLGQMFKKWLSTLGYPVLAKDNFLKYKNIAILDGGDATLKKFAKEELGYRGQKGLDMVLRIKDRFIIGEAKFITASGGTQDKGFRETIAFIKSKGKKALRIAILDGVVWLVSQKKTKKRRKLNLYETVSRLDKRQIALSALLLENFIKELSR